MGKGLNQLSGGVFGSRKEEYVPGDLWMSQWSMEHAQFTFMGFMTLFPKAVSNGVLSTSGKLEVKVVAFDQCHYFFRITESLL